MDLKNHVHKKSQDFIINLLLGRWNITDDLDLTSDVRLYTNSGHVRGYELVYKSYLTDRRTSIRLRINIC